MVRRSPLKTHSRHSSKYDCEALFFQIRAVGLPMPTREFRFHPIRRWRFDLAWPDEMFAVEFEGGIYTGGAHTRGAHFESDCEKYNTATLMGYRVLRFTYKTVKDGTALQMIEKALLGD